MVENHKLLKRFVTNFFKSERYLQPFGEPLTEGEIQTLIQHPQEKQSDRKLMDRLLDDGEAVEMIIDQGEGDAETGSHVISFPEIKKRHPAARMMRQFKQTDLKKVAATYDMTSSDDDELKFEDDQVEGFVQIAAFKGQQFMVSGHFRLKGPHASLRLIFPDGQVVEDIEEEDDLLVFRSIVEERIVLSEICYELY